jgi:hypothetical protein
MKNFTAFSGKPQNFQNPRKSFISHIFIIKILVEKTFLNFQHYSKK